MCLRRSELTALVAKYTKFIQFLFTRLGSGGPWLRGKGTMNEKRKATEDRNTPFSEGLPKLLKSRL